jgi:hypothetical protein
MSIYRNSIKTRQNSSAISSLVRDDNRFKKKTIKVVFLAFNKNIAEELNRRLGNLSSTDYLPLSEYQQKVVEFVLYGSGNGIIQAVAGSGKTTTLMQTMKYLEQKAENENVKIEFEARSSHSFGYGIYSNWAKSQGFDITLDTQKLQKLINQNFSKAKLVQILLNHADDEDSLSKPPIAVFGTRSFERVNFTDDYRDKEVFVVAKNLTYNENHESAYSPVVVGTLEYVKKGKSTTRINFKPLIKGIPPKTVKVESRRGAFFRAKRQLFNDVANEFAYMPPEDKEKYYYVTVDLIDLYYTYVKQLQKIVDYGKNIGVGVPNNVGVQNPKNELSTWVMIQEQYCLLKMDDPNQPYLYYEDIGEICQKILKQSQEMFYTIDFSDMLYMPEYVNAERQAYDFMFLDECQDTNLITQQMLYQSLGKKGRAIAVGDVSQAIYGFRGASAEAMQEFEKLFKAQTLPLSICYRCAKSIIACAQVYLPAITALETAPLGLVSMIYALDKYQYLPEDLSKLFTPNTAILCRSNGPLMKLQAFLFGRGVVSVYLGKNELGASLKQQITEESKKQKTQMFIDISNELKKSLEKRTYALKKKGKVAESEDIKDKIEIFEALNSMVIRQYGENATVNQFKMLLDELMSDQHDESKVTLTTIHRSKGLEFHRVVLYGFDTYSEPENEMESDRPDWIKVQEKNMSYVAITRAERELIFLETLRLKKNQTD